MTRRKSTRQRTAIAELLDDVDGFLSAQDLHARLRGRSASVGLATVYRTLQGLTETGEVDVVRTADGEALYRRCSTGHHHHLVCRHCGRTVEAEGRAVERWARELGDRHGFVDVDHVVEVFGTCASCADRATQEAAG